jgi:hypothetical protein
MDKVHHVKSARKDHKDCGVKVGEPYYWWEIKTGPASGIKKCSKEYPKQSQLTNSPFYQSSYSIIEDINSVSSVENSEELQSLVESWVADIQQIADECEESYNAMPENFQDNSNTGQMLVERQQNMELWIEELEGVDLPDESMFGEDADTGAGNYEDALREALEDIKQIGSSYV